MPLTGASETSWIQVRFASSDEYREVSTDGTEENTKTQKRLNGTLVRYKVVCEPSSYSSEVGANILEPQTIVCGALFTTFGTWTVTDDDIEEFEPGSNSVRNTQILKRFTTWSDYTIP
jgi:hypothetical protein